MVINLPKPVSAITSSASINIDVSSVIDETDIEESFQEIEKTFFDGCVEAILKSSNHQTLVLSKASGSWMENTRMINLSPESGLGVPTNTEYESVELRSCVEIKNATVKWYNYRK